MLFPNDKILQGVADKTTLPALSAQQDVYLALLESIVSQQLSVKAADTIFKRFLGLFENQYPAPEVLVALDPETLRGVGLSRQKGTYLKEVAQFHKAQGIDYQTLDSKTDEEIIKHLIQIKGVGRWTVEMLLIFVLQRADVFAVDDLGIQNAIKKLYALTSEGKELKAEMRTLSEKWKPNRSLACRYLWRWRDTGAE